MILPLLISQRLSWLKYKPRIVISLSVLLPLTYSLRVEYASNGGNSMAAFSELDLKKNQSLPY